MTGSPQYACQPRIACSICTRPIPLEICKTDELGQPVHEECYVRKVSGLGTDNYAVPTHDRGLQELSFVLNYLRYSAY